MSTIYSFGHGGSKDCACRVFYLSRNVASALMHSPVPGVKVYRVRLHAIDGVVFHAEGTSGDDACALATEFASKSVKLKSRMKEQSGSTFQLLDGGYCDDPACSKRVEGTKTA